MRAIILIALAATVAVAVVSPEAVVSGLMAAMTAISEAAMNIAARSVG